MRQNYMLILFAAVFVILALGCALLRGKKALIALVALVTITCVLLAIFRPHLVTRP